MGALADFSEQIADFHSNVFIPSAGTDVVVRNRDLSERTVTVLIQPIRPEEVLSIGLEGAYNVTSGRPTVFSFPGDDVLPETGSVIIWDGWEWEVKDMPKTPAGTVFMNKAVLCTRKKPA